MGGYEGMRRQVNSVAILLDDVYMEALKVITASGVKHGLKAVAGQHAVEIARSYHQGRVTADQAKEQLWKLHKP